MQFREVSYQHPDASRLIDEVQQYYVTIYGGPDTTPVDPGEFARPLGAFFLGYDNSPLAVVMGGWRFRPAGASVLGHHAAEIKRMYVVRSARGLGHARALLGHLEDSAADAGADAIVLETGIAQPEAIALYRSAGYADVPPFGHYADAEGAVHMGKVLPVRA